MVACRRRLYLVGSRTDRSHVLNIESNLQCLAAVTMRRVAAELGTGAASPYRHVATRDDLVDLMVDRALGEFDPIPDTGDWRADVVAAQMTLLHRAVSDGAPWFTHGASRRLTPVSTA